MVAVGPELPHQGQAGGRVGRVYSECWRLHCPLDAMPCGKLAGTAWPGSSSSLCCLQAAQSPGGAPHSGGGKGAPGEEAA